MATNHGVGGSNPSLPENIQKLDRKETQTTQTQLSKRDIDLISGILLQILLLSKKRELNSIDIK